MGMACVSCAVEGYRTGKLIGGRDIAPGLPLLWTASFPHCSGTLGNHLRQRGPYYAEELSPEGTV